MKPVSQRIEPVKKVAQQREQRAADQLNKTQTDYQSAQHKLHELVQYRTDYLAEFQYRAAKGMSGIQLQHYKSFLSQLDKAIAAQQQQILQLQTQVSQSRKQWQSQNQRTQAVNKYQDKLKQKERLQSERKQARVLEDDFNSQTHTTH
ncbi:flagellar export protein FliJ [Pleionea litopenaei]|uniref:Flagellar FliJ protein n=1 Tax=Pleionea litopenaei TaxID=3070815 RepID=A0AA51RTZ3_9GAMM|nr:flagellar export protein FliJ [Pleionea sp. HL-JVS1]WMS87666.1 flagellar export protein FliJ [Pleionea sp. HL-JVS1]